MESYQFFLPTKVISGENCIVNNKEMFSTFGKKALIVTGKSSAKNGSLSDVISALSSQNIGYEVYDETEENPSLLCVQKAAEIGISANCDFVIAVGGGSPLDAGKATAYLINNPDSTAENLFDKSPMTASPIIAVPTTAGTGSEVTPNFILTKHDIKTKTSAVKKLFPNLAFLDSRYLRNLPNSIMVSTVLDALCHLTEAYLTKLSNPISEGICMTAFQKFSKVKNSLTEGKYSDEELDEFLLISTYGGFAIAQALTCLPHLLGYNLTYYKNVPHGTATAIFLYEYLNIFKNKDKVNALVSACGFSDLDEFGAFLKGLISLDESFTDKEIEEYIEFSYKNKEKIALHPEPISFEEFKKVGESVKTYIK